MGKLWGDSLSYCLDLFSEWSIKSIDSCHNVLLGGVTVELHRIKKKKIKLVYLSLEMESFILTFSNFSFHFLLLCFQVFYMFIYINQELALHWSLKLIGAILSLQKRLLRKNWASNLSCICELSFSRCTVIRSLTPLGISGNIQCLLLGAEGTCPCSYQWKHSFLPLIIVCVK